MPAYLGVGIQALALESLSSMEEVGLEPPSL